MSGIDDVMHSVDLLMARYSGAVPGASLLVVCDGAPVVRRAYGYADLESRIAATAATNYRLASVTKQFTAAAGLLLAQDQRLTLDDPVRKWLPSLPDATEPVTIRHLLTHSSGVVAYEDLIPEGTTTQVHDADVLLLLERENRTYFRPGTSYRYSNSGYALLALIVERASGQSFASFLRDRIFAPLGMHQTVAHQEGISIVSSRAFGYSRSNGGWTRDDQSLTSAVLGDGGIYSSVDDLTRWDASLYNDRLLGDEVRQAAFSPLTPTDDPNVHYGFGWRITGDRHWHSGETRGFRNVIVRWPQRRLTVAILTNRNEAPPHATALTIGALFLDGKRCGGL